MAEVKLSDVAKLRKMTGAGMMDCKKALEDANCDFDKAVELIREHGKAIASKRADRDASEGVVLSAQEGGRAAIVCLNCETDFVAKNADFIALAERILQAGMAAATPDAAALRNLDIDGKTAESLVQEFSGVTGEKMELSHFALLEGKGLATYTHPGNKLAAAVCVNKPDADPTLLRELAMQVAGMNPVAVDADGVPEEVRRKEFEIGREQARLEGKPEAMLDKIAEGRLNKFLKENTLLAQEFVKEGKITVGQYIARQDKELKVLSIARYSLMD